MSIGALPVLSQQGGLTQYMRDIQKFPMLTADEEYMLSKRYLEHDDMSAAHRMVTSHLRLVAKIAMGYRGYGLPLSEMIAEGNIGLMQAVKKFDPERGFRLSTYAMWWIKASIQEYVLKSWSVVKMGTTLAQKKLFFNLKRMKNRLNAIDNTDLSPDQVSEIANELNVGEDDVVAMNRRMIAHDKPLNAPIGEDSREEAMAFLASEEDNPEEQVAEADETHHRRSLLLNAMNTLKERERDIFAQRRLSDPAKTLEELSQVYKVSRERIRQIEARAYEKVEAHMREAVIASA